MADEVVARFETLDRETCLGLLAGRAVGRLAWVVDGRPEVLPVNFVLEGDRIVFRTAEGTMLHRAAQAVVAFEVDQVDEAGHTGWSVLVQGPAWDITDAIDPTSEHLRRLGLVAWAPGRRPRWFAVGAERVTGRRISVAAPG